MEICHHWKNERANPAMSRHNNEVVVGARRALDHWSDIAMCGIGHAVAIPLLNMRATR
jgi:hypothetical protein